MEFPIYGDGGEGEVVWDENDDEAEVEKWDGDDVVRLGGGDGGLEVEVVEEEAMSSGGDGGGDETSDGATSKVQQREDVEEEI